MTNRDIEDVKNRIDELVKIAKDRESENAVLKQQVKTQREKIDSLLKELEEEKGKMITISDEAITMRADMWEALAENKSLKDEITLLKQHIKEMEDICNGSCFSGCEELTYGDEPEEKDALIAELQDQHQQDCIRINDLTTTVHVLAGLYSLLRKNVGMD